MSGSLKENDRLPSTQSKLPFNFRFGEAKRCLGTLVREGDLNNAHNEIKRKRDIGQSLKEKYEKCRRITSAQISCHTECHVVGKYCLEDTLRRFQIKKDKMNAKELSCDAMYILAKIRDSEKMDPEQLRKVLVPLKRKQDKAMLITQNDLLICYYQWIHVEKRERRVIGGEENNLNASNSTYCANKSISENAADELIATAINAVDPTDFSGDAAGGLTAAINAGNSTDCADLSISNDAVDGLIDNAIDAGYLTGCAEDAAGGLIDAINAGNPMDCADITVPDDAADGLITTIIDAGILADCAEDDAGG